MPWKVRQSFWLTSSLQQIYEIREECVRVCHFNSGEKTTHIMRARRMESIRFCVVVSAWCISRQILWIRMLSLLGHFYFKYSSQNCSKLLDLTSGLVCMVHLKYKFAFSEMLSGHLEKLCCETFNYIHLLYKCWTLYSTTFLNIIQIK